MLIDFTFKNVRSFKEETTFSMEIGEGITEYQQENTISNGTFDVVKSAFVFGGNASGKTNLLRAFYLLRRIVLKGTSSDIDTLPTETYVNEGGSIYFKIQFVKNDKHIIYTLEYDWVHIIYEELVVDNEVIFKRSQDSIQMPRMLENLTASLRLNQPLLYFAQTNNVPEAKLVYEWFALDIVIPSVSMDTISSQQLFRPLYKNPALTEKVLYALKAADFNIKAINIEELVVPATSDSNDNKIVLVLRFVHQGEDNNTFIVDYEAESIGTRIFLLLAMTILQNEGSSKLFLIDEFDRSLHPKLVKILFHIFNTWNQSATQLIATTHNNDILDYPLRTDQIWFVDKNYHGVSKLDSAFDYDELTIQDIKKNYQDGVYGADQIINTAMMKELLGVQDIE